MSVNDMYVQLTPYAIAQIVVERAAGILESIDKGEYTPDEVPCAGWDDYFEVQVVSDETLSLPVGGEDKDKKVISLQGTARRNLAVICFGQYLMAMNEPALKDLEVSCLTREYQLEVLAHSWESLDTEGEAYSGVGVPEHIRNFVEAPAQQVGRFLPGIANMRASGFFFQLLPLALVALQQEEEEETKRALLQEDERAKRMYGVQSEPA
ncbi:MAG: hypothetical protein DI585_02380 [Pseudomonas fluorescens]|nr:MAG: hypothetical protein DI585_02380 [Pseudomonas fluorescens]